MPENATLSSGMVEKFHDAELRSFETIREERFVKLSFILQSSEIYQIQLHNIAAFRAVDIIHQNVISSLLVSTIFEFSPERAVHFIKWTNSLTDNSSLINDQQIARYVDRLTRREIMLFVLEPSWGAEIAALCESISISPQA